jgi:hypothetical protein
LGAGCEVIYPNRFSKPVRYEFKIIKIKKA